jgi:hypothetical protein
VGSAVVTEIARPLIHVSVFGLSRTKPQKKRGKREDKFDYKEPSGATPQSKKKQKRKEN